MQLRCCPICGVKNLLPSSVIEGEEEIVICVNENYTHFQVGIFQYLAHTPSNLIEEDRKPSDLVVFHVEKDTLVLN